MTIHNLNPVANSDGIRITLVEPAGGPLRLSQWGREALAMLHDDFIKMLNTEGMPAEPTAH